MPDSAVMAVSSSSLLPTPTTAPSQAASGLVPKVISVVGPTASGKTGLAIGLAQRLRAEGQAAEIINADAYQMYRGMDVGTAKATAEERAAVPHHLIDIIGPDEEMSAARFQALARQCIADLQGQGVRPILVGGSGLYARAALDDIGFQGTDPQIRAGLERRAQTEGPGVLFAELQAKDPVAAARMDPRNPRRTIRALEVIALTGQPYSASLPVYRYLIPALQIGLDLDRQLLDQRIDQRTQLMRRQGLVEEVRGLQGKLSLTASRALGYQQINDFLAGQLSEQEAFDLIAQKTKRLARKQMGWFGRDPRIHWLDAAAPDLLDQACALVRRADAGQLVEPGSEPGESAQPVSHPLGALTSPAQSAFDGSVL